MSTFTGTWPLVKAIARRDRVRVAVWVGGLAVFVVVTVASTKGLFPDQASLDQAARASESNPAAAAFNGPLIALDTLGGQVAFQLGAFGLTMVALMGILLLNRATRVEEEAGRLELVRALPVGRDAPLAAGALVVAGSIVLVGTLTAVALLLEGLPVAGSIALGASFTTLGLLFVGVTAVCAQVSENHRVVSGTAGAVLGAAFVLRAVGDAGSGALSWASPIGWAQKTRPYGGEAWWPLGLCVVVAAVLVRVAVELSRRRDFGAGLVAPSPGPANAARSLGSGVGLAVRLQRGVVVGWTVGVVAMAVAWGSLANTINEFVEDNDAIREFIARTGGADLVDSYLSTAFITLALLVAGAGLQIILRVRTEETEGRAECILATPTSRSAWLGGHLAVALGGTVIGLCAAGLGLGVTAAIALHDLGQVTRLIAAAMAYLPAVACMLGVAVLIHGRWPRFVSAIWGFWAFCLIVAFFGVLLDLPGVVFDLSPFEHTPLVPADPLRILPLVLLTVVGTAAAGLGLRALARRDIGA